MSDGGYQEGKIRGKEGRGVERKKKKKRIYLLKFIYEGVPPTSGLKVAKYIPFFCKKERFFCYEWILMNPVMDNAAAR